MSASRMYVCLLGLWGLLGVSGAQESRPLDLPSCLDSFDIHQDKIIRTQDSRAMGAKYINERDVPTREDCLRLCCETQDCDVFVFEEKTPGSCYLFQCGTPEDFKCKFTKHHNYTSAVLVLNRHLTELESQIKHTQHEHELAKLRKPESKPVSPTVSEIPTTSIPGSKEVAPVIPTTPDFVQRSHCSRYQFECRGSGECIAIYNACDGIPQCSDGSDEAPELGCPAQGSTAAPVAKPNPLQESASMSIQQPQQQPSSSRQTYHISSDVPGVQTPVADSMPVLSKQFPSNQWNPPMFDSQHIGNQGNNYLQPNTQQMSPQIEMQTAPQQPQQSSDFPQPPPELVRQAKQYGREGEGLIYHPPGPNDMLQWPANYQQEQMTNYRNSNSGGSQIFSHKGSGLVSQSDRYRHVHGNKVVGEGGITSQFEPMGAEYGRYNNYYESGPYHKAPQAPANWQPMHKPLASMNSLGADENMNVPVPQNIPGQDYYYEENFRTRLQPQIIPQRLSPQNSQLVPQESSKFKPIQKGESEVENQESAVESASKTTNPKTSVKKESAHHSSVANSTEKPKEVRHHAEHHHSSHRKVETLSAELSLTENTFDSDGDGQNLNPRGAILSLTMGLCVTGIMLVLVGCRMRMVRRRMRRGSKSPYAHDADFLVNGMYL